MPDREIDYTDSTVLVVDDVAQNVQIASAILEMDGYAVETALSGKEALERVRAGGVDLILLDIMMPEVDGFQVAEELQQSEETAAIPIIFLTARNDTDSITRGFRTGAVDYITKPFKGEELKMRVRTHLKLRHTQRELREANAAKDKFFSIIAHDLRSPFTALVGMSQYLADGIENLDADTAKEFLQGMHTSSKNAYNLLENLLEWSRVQTGRMPMEPERIDAAEILKENLSLLEVNINNKELEVDNQLGATEPVWADPNAVQTIFRNLLSNAIKFTPQGGTISLFSRHLEDMAAFTVKDTGVGMDEATREGLFRIDVRHSSKGTNKEKGSGLGLILCREFVERNGGDITVESEPGRGTMFTFTLPLPGGDRGGSGTRGTESREED
jgi:signal transduction histidine kinase